MLRACAHRTAQLPEPAPSGSLPADRCCSLDVIFAPGTGVENAVRVAQRPPGHSTGTPAGALPATRCRPTSGDTRRHSPSCLRRQPALHGVYSESMRCPPNKRSSPRSDLCFPRSRAGGQGSRPKAPPKDLRPPNRRRRDRMDKRLRRHATSKVF